MSKNPFEMDQSICTILRRFFISFPTSMEEIVTVIYDRRGNEYIVKIGIKAIFVFCIFDPCDALRGRICGEFSIDLGKKK